MRPFLTQSVWDVQGTDGQGLVESEEGLEEATDGEVDQAAGHHGEAQREKEHTRQDPK